MSLNDKILKLFNIEIGYGRYSIGCYVNRDFNLVYFCNDHRIRNISRSLCNEIRKGKQNG